MNNILEKYPRYWRVEKITFGAYIKDANGKVLLKIGQQGLDIDLLEFIAETVNGHGDTKKDVTEFWGFGPLPWI